MRVVISDILIDIQKKNIKNMHLQVKPPDGHVVISAPSSMDDKAIEVYARTNLSWIKNQIEKFKQQSRCDKRQYVSGETVYIWGKHPLANEKSISFEQLADYPCLSFEQGEKGSFYFAEEILSTNEYPRIIKATDRSTMLNLMVGLDGYTLCSGIICEELNGSDFVAVPFEGDADNPNPSMEIGYIRKKHSPLTEIGATYIEEMAKYLAKCR